MRWLLNAVVLSCCFTFAVLSESPGDCVIDLECPECIPENMPLVTSHRAANGTVRVLEGDEVSLSCARGKFLSFPLRGAVAARCAAGRLHVGGRARHLLELGCQESVFEDVLHHVEHCAAPLQGRAYQLQDEHLALLCYDEDRGAAVRAHACSARLPLAPHAEAARSPLSLLGNFNHMFDAKTRADAERLYSDDVSTNKRLRELLKHEGHSFAGQTITAGKLLSPLYFEDQSARVTDFASNKVPVWRSVAEGNLRHLQEDVGALMSRTRGNATLHVHVHAGTHEVLSLRGAAPAGRAELFLRGARFPVPRYVWTAVTLGGRGAAIVLLNDPFVSISEVREAVFCESVCARLGWAAALRRARRYETPLYGLVFCCELRALAARVPGLPQDLIQHIRRGTEGLLTDA